MKGFDGMRRGLAAFGAAAMLAGALAPATALAVDAPSADPGSPAKGGADAQEVSSDTDVVLVVNDKGATTMSVTAPLKVYLAVDVEKGDTTTEVFDFAVPSADAARITNNSVNAKVKLAGYKVSDGGRGLNKLATGDDDATGFWKQGTTEFKTENLKTSADNAYWLQAKVANQGKEATIELGRAAANLSALEGAEALVMAENDESGSALYSSLPLSLSGQIHNPDKTAFGGEDGAQLSRITWTFARVSK